MNEKMSNQEKISNVAGTSAARALALMVLENAASFPEIMKKHMREAAWEVFMEDASDSAIEAACLTVTATLLNEDPDNLISDDDGETYYSEQNATRRVDCTASFPEIMLP